jgi:hypothetical protein
VLGADSTPDGTRAFAACMDRGIYDINPESGSFERIGEHERAHLDTATIIGR